MTIWGLSSKFFPGFHSSLQKYIQTVTKHVDRIEASALFGTAIVTSIPEQLILERNIEEFDMDRIANQLCID